jgi:hypothetical protein
MKIFSNRNYNATSGGNIQCLVLLIVIGIKFLLPNSALAMGTIIMPEGKGLYIYSNRELSNFIKDIGYPDFWAKSGTIVSRNSNGTELRFFSKLKKKVITVSCDGSIKELDIPGFPTWLNDNHDAVAWHDWDKSVVYYENGMHDNISEAFGRGSGPDPSGNYFVKYSSPSYGIPLSESCSTEIYTIKGPDSPVATVAVCGIRKIFSKADKVFLFGNDYHEKIHNDKIITVHIFQKNNDGLMQVETIAIQPPRISPAPFYVEDFSPWDDDVLLIDVYDMPRRSVWHSFNLRTHEMKEIGKVPFSGGMGFYLQCNIIKEVIEKHMKAK